MNRHSLTFMQGLLREISLTVNEARLEQVLTVARDVRKAIQSKDFNGVTSYKNIYLLLKDAEEKSQLASDIATGSSD